MKKKKQKFGLVILLVGILLFLFPFVSMIKDDLQQHATEIAYQRYQKTHQQKLQKQRQALEQTTLSGTIQDIFTQKQVEAAKQTPYTSLVDTKKTVGYMSIPALGQHFDLYLDADYDKLAKGVATLVGSSAPLGIRGQRPIIAGHRINYNGMSFYFLSNLKKGDKIYIHFLDKKLEYEVSGSEVIDEYDNDKLSPVAGEDMITLMTCVNAPNYDKRLLVNAKRVPKESKAPQNLLAYFVADKQIPLTFKLQRLLPYFLVLIGIGIFLIFLKQFFNLYKKD